MSQKTLLVVPEIVALTGALRRDSVKLKDLGDKYKKMMDAMASVWQGSSGKSFAEAAGRVEAGFVVNRSVLEQMVVDVTNSQKSIADQDDLTAKAIAVAEIK